MYMAGRHVGSMNMPNRLNVQKKIPLSSLKGESEMHPGRVMHKKAHSRTWNTITIP